MNGYFDGSDDLVILFDCTHTLTISRSEMMSFRSESAFRRSLLSRQCALCGKHATDFALDGYLR
jgi:hypothetical protein